MQFLVTDFSSDFIGTFIQIGDGNESRKTGRFEVSFRTINSYHINVSFDDEIQLNLWVPITIYNINKPKADIVRYLEVRFEVIPKVYNV